jgi:two-component system, sensor histidine kinase
MPIESALAAASTSTSVQHGDTVAKERLRLMSGQVRRSLRVALVVDGVLLWFLWRDGLGELGLLWAALQLALQAFRAWFAKHLTLKGGGSARIDLHRMAWVFAAIGAARALILFPLFALPLSGVHYVFTLVFLGLAAGGVSSVAGSTRAFALWSLPIAVTLTVGWFLFNTAEARAIGVLLPITFVVLTMYVRDQGAAQATLVNLAESLTIERDRAQAANESKTRFFASASHDLRQPLHALSINATTLALIARKQEDALIKELSQSINRALRQSNNLLDSLLEISRLDAGSIQLQMATLNVSNLWKNLQDTFAPIAATQGRVQLRCEVPTDPPLWVHSDEDLLMRILGNLVGNALKFTHEGEIIFTAAPGAGDTVTLTVQDSGIGIANDELEKVFEEFYQVGNASRDRSLGLGLGLSIVRRAASLLGLGLHLDSELDKGTRVTLTLPKATAPATAASTASEPIPDQAQELRLHARVLLVDDEEEILRSLAAMLPLFGCDVRCARDSTEALATLDAGFSPQVLVVDHRLRTESGADVVRAVHQRLGPVPALLITGDTAPDRLPQTQALGMRVIHKPIDGVSLVQAMTETLQEKQA